MQTQFVSLLVSFINRLFAFVCALLSNPQRVRLIVTGIAVCLLVAALLIPTLATLADGAGLGGH